MTATPARLTVGEITQLEIYTVDPMASVRVAMRQMGKKGASLVIERRDADGEPDVIDVLDVGREVIASNHSPDRVDMSAIMSKPILTLPAEIDVKYGVRMPVRFGRTRALVIGHGRNLVGVVTLRDMVMAAADLQGPST